MGGAGAGGGPACEAAAVVQFVGACASFPPLKVEAAAAVAAVAADPELAAGVRAVYLESCLREGGWLGRQMQDTEAALGRSSAGSAWFTRC